MSITATIVFDDASMNVARKWHWRKFGMAQWLWPLGGMLLIPMGICIIRAPHGSTTFGGLLVFTGLYCLLRKWILGIFHRDALRKSPHFRKSFTWTITEHHVETQGEGSVSKLAWNQFHESVSTPDGLLLYQYKNSYYWIPRTAFSSDSDFDDAKRIIASATRHRELK